MPIDFGIGMSHPGTIRLTSPEEWEASYRRLIRTTPQPGDAVAETMEVVSSHIDRVQASLEELRRRLAIYDPELLIVIGGDQTEVFDRSNVPNLMIYLGDQASGYERTSGSDNNLEVPINIDLETSRWLLTKLVKSEGFDIAFSADQTSLAGRGPGVSHAFWRPALTVFKSIPTVLIWESTYDPPSLSAKRCYELGQALARLFKDDPRRIAIMGSGGLSHDPGGPRAGWIDEPLDRWFIDQIKEGNGAQAESMFKFDSATMDGGTGEIRAWITAAGAMEASGQRFELIDYIPAHHAVTGLAFGTWPSVDAIPVVRKETAGAAGD